MKLLATLTLISLFTQKQMICTAQPCKLSCPSNMIVSAEKGQEGANVVFPQATPSGNCGAITYSPASGSFFRLGSHSIIASTATGQKCSFTITITDNEPPTLSALTLSRNQLWPASNKMKYVTVSYTAADNTHDVSTVLTVYSNDTTSNIKDYEILNNHMLRLKASRLADGTPRIYTITVTATDEAGNKTKRTASIAVSKTMIHINPS